MPGLIGTSVPGQAGMPIPGKIDPQTLINMLPSTPVPKSPPGTPKYPQKIDMKSLLGAMDTATRKEGRIPGPVW